MSQLHADMIATSGRGNGPQSQVSRRLLLASYFFGPNCETGGLRWNAITEHLAEAGWEVDVLAAARPGAERPYQFVPGVRVTPLPVPTGLGDLVDSVGRARRSLGALVRPAGKPSVAMESPPALPRVDGSEPAPGLYDRLMGNLSAASRWSAQVGWSRRAVKAGLRLARERRPAVIAVSSPPHPTQLAGVGLSRALSVPLLADMRDPWLYGELDVAQSKMVDLKLGDWAQSRTLTQAARFVCNTEWAAKALLEHEPGLAGRVLSIPNGYDPSPEISVPDTELFRVAFVGWLYEFMDPEPLLAACGRLRLREGLEQLRVEFVGTGESWGGVSLQDRARAHGLEGYVEHRARVPRDEARRVQQRAAVQVVYDAPGPYRVPMKFYDAVQCRGDMLLLGSTPSAMADAAAEVGLTVCPRYVPDIMDASLSRSLARWRSRKYDAVIDERGVFDRVHGNRRMQHELEALVSAAAVVSR